MNTKESNLNLIFPTPIWVALVPNYKEVNKVMLSYIKSLQSADVAGITKSNSDGWHSKNFDLKQQEPQFFTNSISSLLNKSLNDMGWDLEKNKTKITAMWSIINPKNASNMRHIHPNNFISPAYYVKASEKSGDIVFYDPRSANTIRSPIVSKTNKLNSNIFSVQPREGLLVLFPSYIHHSVNRNSSEEERIVLSFNINLIS